jgi:hypothetical protein
MESPPDRDQLRQRLGELFDLGQTPTPRGFASWVPALLGRPRR